MGSTTHDGLAVCQKIVDQDSQVSSWCLHTKCAAIYERLRLSVNC